jgi:hypothetical protein
MQSLPAPVSALEKTWQIRGLDPKTHKLGDDARMLTWRYLLERAACLKVAYGATMPKIRGCHCG